MTFKYGSSKTGLLLEVTAVAREGREFWLSLGQHSQVVISCNFIILNTLRPAWTHKATLPTELESDNDVLEKYRRPVCRCAGVRGSFFLKTFSHIGSVDK